MGHFVTPPNGYNDPMSEDLIRQLDSSSYATWKGGMLRTNSDIVEYHDGVLVLNFSKNGTDNYIGGSTFLEAFKAFELQKKLYLYNPIPDGMLRDEIIGLDPVVINGDLGLIK